MELSRTARALCAGALVAAAGSTAGCGTRCQLDGSAGAQLSLAFDNCIIALQSDQYLIVEFTLDDGSEVVELTVDTAVCPIEPNVEIAFDSTCWFIDRTMIDMSEFDSILQGRITLFTWGGIGDNIDGDFAMEFDNGLALSGEFHGKLLERTG